MGKRIKINDVTVVDLNDGIYVAPNPDLSRVNEETLALIQADYRRTRGNELQNPFIVMCYDKDGREYTHEKEFSSRVQALALALRIKSQGSIDSTYWSCQVPYGTSAWLIDDMEVTLLGETT